jgi:hypothetical protein
MSNASKLTDAGKMAAEQTLAAMVFLCHRAIGMSRWS